MSTESDGFEVVTLTLNPAIDQTLTIANFQAGSVNRVQNERQAPGGKGVNAAVALADYGVRVLATGLIGRDNVAPFEALFREKGIGDAFVRVPGSTRTGIKIVDPMLGLTTDINFPGALAQGEHLEALASRMAALDARCIVLAGSLPPGVAPDYYERLVHRFKQRAARVIVDTSGEALEHVIRAKPHVIKPNRDELEALLGCSLESDQAIVEAARELVAEGIETVVVSLGKRGACFVAAEQVCIARPPEVNVESTVGAGDAMVAGLTVSELEGLSLSARARLATAFSVDALTCTGSRASSRARIDALLGKVHVT